MHEETIFRSDIHWVNYFAVCAVHRRIQMSRFPWSKINDVLKPHHWF